MKTKRNNHLTRLGFLLILLALGLTGCFKDAGEGKAAATRQQVNLRDIQQQRTPTPALATPTTARAIPTFTPESAISSSKTLVIGGPPVSSGASEENGSNPTEFPHPTATNVPPELATVAPPGFGNSGISPTPSLTFTPSQVPGQPTPTAIATLDECIYVVQGGDTLFSIAREYDLFPEDFIPLNPELQADPDSLYIGQQLRIPGCVSENEGSATPSDGGPASTTVPGGTQTYVVQAGDNLFRIAVRFNVSLASLLQANGLTESSVIYPGDVLVIPQQ